jgi:hypothetical protein
MSDIERQLLRLRRHYEASLQTYDELTLLDLSHALRLVIESRAELASIGPRYSSETAFKIGKPIGKINAAAHGTEYVLCYMPGGVRTRAGTVELANIPIDSRHHQNFASAIGVRKTQSLIEMDQYCVIFKAIDHDVMKTFCSKNGASISSVTFQQYLAADAVRVAFLNHKKEYERRIISREMIAKVVANTLGASHSYQDASQGNSNSFAEAVHHLLRFKWGDLPLPYFIIMKIAQDILAISEIER